MAGECRRGDFESSHGGVGGIVREERQAKWKVRIRGFHLFFGFHSPYLNDPSSPPFPSSFPPSSSKG